MQYGLINCSYLLVGIYLQHSLLLVVCILVQCTCSYNRVSCLCSASTFQGCAVTMASSLAYRPEVRERMKNEFLNDENYNFEAVNRASKACGPLVQWAVAQVCGCGRE